MLETLTSRLLYVPGLGLCPDWDDAPATMSTQLGPLSPFLYSCSQLSRRVLMAQAPWGHHPTV